MECIAQSVIGADAQLAQNICTHAQVHTPPGVPSFKCLHAPSRQNTELAPATDSLLRISFHS
jgi:hypothetical protein